MYFTQNDYKKIESWLSHRSIKDTEFSTATEITDKDIITIIQGGENKKTPIYTILNEALNRADFVNLSDRYKQYYVDPDQLISLVPIDQRKLGYIMTFQDKKGHWDILQFIGGIDQWNSLSNWRNPLLYAIEKYVFFPDEEDITGKASKDKVYLKFKDKLYDPDTYSGFGRVFLRKNLVCVGSDDSDEDVYENRLTQDMFTQTYTIYIVQYDYDLNGEIITIPEGSVLYFCGGSINNGTVQLQKTSIWGVFTIAEMGTASFIYPWATGQVFWFTNDSYQSLTGDYFTETTKESSASSEEDANEDTEVFYEVNSSAYELTERLTLCWWNGESWIRILDITDYEEIISILDAIIEKHNAEISAVYKYFKARCYALELRVDDLEDRMDSAESRLDSIDSSIESINTTISELREELLEAINNITFPIATTSTLGGVIIGDGLTISSDGTVSVDVDSLNISASSSDITITTTSSVYLTGITSTSTTTTDTLYRPTSSIGSTSVPTYLASGGSLTACYTYSSDYIGASEYISTVTSSGIQHVGRYIYFHDPSGYDGKGTNTNYNAQLDLGTNSDYSRKYYFSPNIGEGTFGMVVYDRTNGDSAVGDESTPVYVDKYGEVHACSINSSGSTVSIDTSFTSGTEIATITVDNTEYTIYAPESTSSDGTGTLTIGSTSSTLYLLGVTSTDTTSTTSLYRRSSAVGNAYTPVYIGSTGAVTICNTYSDSNIGSSSYVPYVSSSGIIEIGRYIDFHDPSSSDSGDSYNNSDYNVRIDVGSSSDADTQRKYYFHPSVGAGTFNVAVASGSVGSSSVPVYINSYGQVTACSYDLSTLSGSSSSYTLPVATSSTLGGIIIGDGFTIATDGTISIDDDYIEDLIESNTTNYWYKSSSNIYAGTSTTPSYAVYATAFYESSDARLKNNIFDIDSEDIQKVEEIQHKTFTLNSDNSEHYGVIAQSVEEAGLERLVSTNKDGYKSVDYTSLLILENEALRRKVSNLEERLAALETKLG